MVAAGNTKVGTVTSGKKTGIRTIMAGGGTGGTDGVGLLTGAGIRIGMDGSGDRNLL
jgi:hypothetical protein